MSTTTHAVFVSPHIIIIMYFQWYMCISVGIKCYLCLGAREHARHTVSCFVCVRDPFGSGVVWDPFDDNSEATHVDCSWNLFVQQQQLIESVEVTADQLTKLTYAYFAFQHTHSAKIIIIISNRCMNDNHPVLYIHAPRHQHLQWVHYSLEFIW